MTTAIYEELAPTTKTSIGVPGQVEYGGTSFLDGEIIFKRMLWIKVNRMRKLTQYRNITGLLALFLLVLAALSPLGGLSYEPALALFLAVFGTFVVFAMKVADSK